MATGGGNRAIVAALVANLGIAVAKFIGFVITGASSLLAEAVHSVADSGNQLLLLYGKRRSAKPATEIHQFGYSRARYFWAFVVSLVLFSLGGLFSLYEGFEKLMHLEPITRPEVGITILAVAILLEAFSLRTAVRETNQVRGTSSWWQFVRHSRAPELPVVLLEDLGALVGLALAMIGVVATTVTGDPHYDAYGTLAIGVLLFCIALLLAVEMQSLLIGEAASADDFTKIRAAITDDAEVARLLSVKTEHLGPEQLLIAAHVQFVEGLDLAGVVTAIDRIESRMRDALPSARHIYIEPDVPSEWQATGDDTADQPSSA